MRLRTLVDPDHLPALDRGAALERPALDLGPLDHPPRILLLYGSLRETSYSRLAVDAANTKKKTSDPVAWVARAAA